MKRLLLVLFVVVLGATPTPPSEVPEAGRCLADACGAVTPQGASGARRLAAVHDGLPPELPPVLLPPVAVQLPVRPVADRPSPPPPALPSPRLSQGPPLSA